MKMNLQSVLSGAAMIALATVALPNAAHASLVCSTPGICVSEATIAATIVDFSNQSLVFDKFDTGLGTLNSVTLTFLPTGTQDTSKKTQVITSGWFQNQSG